MAPERVCTICGNAVLGLDARVSLERVRRAWGGKGGFDGRASMDGSVLWRGLGKRLFCRKELLLFLSVPKAWQALGP